MNIQYRLGVIFISAILLIILVYTIFHRQTPGPRMWGVPGPMVVTEFPENSFPYELQKQIEIQVNNIIGQEIDIALKQYNKTDLLQDFARFRLKERLWITLYYVGKINEPKEDLFVDALTEMQKHNKGIGPIAPVKISDHFDFFGSIKELVVKIDDNTQSLTQLRADIKNAFMALNATFAKSHGKPLYDPSFSEQYQYEPHITFGHLSSTIAKFLEKNNIPSRDIMNKIFTRIKSDLPSLLKLSDSQRTLKIDAFQFNSSDRKIVGKFHLKS